MMIATHLSTMALAAGWLLLAGATRLAAQDVPAGAVASVAMAQAAGAAAAAPAGEVPLPAQALSMSDQGRRIVVSVEGRTLWLLSGQSVLLRARVAVGQPVKMEFDGQVWDFSTPRGRRVVLTKEKDPVWIPPDWHYVELASLQGWKLARLGSSRPARLADGSRLEIRRNRVVRVSAAGAVTQLPAGVEIVVGDTLYMPPIGSLNRRVPGALGSYRLNLGDGYAIHGTPDLGSIGGAETHGCVRMEETDLAALVAQVSVGTPVYVF